MPSFLSARVLYRDEGLIVRDVVCRPHGHGPDPEEENGVNSIAFPRSGFFVREVGGREVAADANAVLFFTRGAVERVRHPVDAGDACTVFEFDDETLLEAGAENDPRAVERPGRPFPAASVPSAPALFTLAEAIRRHLPEEGADPAAVRDAAWRLLDAALGSAREPAPVSSAMRTATRRANRERVAATRELLARRLADGAALSAIAREVACSPYHLARIFREETGVPIHRYMNRLRLRAGLERLASPEPLTTIAHDLGFASHAHFTEAFRREFGFAPSRLRRPASAATLGELRKKLKA